MTERSSRDSVAGFFGVLALTFGILQCIWVPFAFAPLALISLITAIMLSPRNHRLYQLDVVVISFGFVIGATVAVLGENPLY